MSDSAFDAVPLGKTVAYGASYSPALLCPLPRSDKREALGLKTGATLPFSGVDIWNGYELSWLLPSGKPVVAMARFVFPAETPYLIESKSFKLYLNSLNQSVFSDIQAVIDVLTEDLSHAAQGAVKVELFPLPLMAGQGLTLFEGENIDAQEISCSVYTVEPNFLSATGDIVTETLTSDLLKSNCLVTGQPDWGSLQIHYTGPQMDRVGLLRYIVSFRQHNEFHEHCVERIFTDIWSRCLPQHLSVAAAYTRRGGLDINPFRTSDPRQNAPFQVRLVRQ